jgi:hypothetical protein
LVILEDIPKWPKNDPKMKVVCFVLFCSYLGDPPNWDASNHVLNIFGKLLMRRGAWAWFRGVLTSNAKVLEY